MVDIYLVDTRINGRKDRPHPSLPFQRFYLIPRDVPLSKFRRLAPYSIIVDLNENYEPVLTTCGVPFKELFEKRYRVMVPIGMSRTFNIKNKTELLSPTRLSVGNWERAHESRLGEFFSDTDTTLLTPEEEITPICLSCDMHLDHMVGGCVLGTEICTRHLCVQYKSVSMNLTPLKVKEMK